MKAARPLRETVAGLALVCAVVSASSATADSVRDGEAGLQALDRGAYDEAIADFTRALDAGDLNADDQELAHLNRGKAYLAEGDDAHAVADLREAVRLKPADVEAQQVLAQALAGGSRTGTAQDAGDGAPWGLFADLAGHYYWFSIVGGDPHAAYMTYGWVTPGKVLSAVIHNKKGVSAALEFVINDDGHRLLLVGQYPSDTLYGTAASRGDIAYEWSYSKGVPITQRLTRAADGSVSLTETRYANGRWQPQDPAVSFVPTTKAEIIAAGFNKVP